MQPWTSTPVPRLSGHGRPLRLYDTAAGAVRPTAPGRTARMYVCGITPYDATHLGHAATYLAFDLVNRYWRDAG
ncbi:MAG: cysteine--1-D-myo-inosityl 2-amino-2-deoxy-alpha-D-glucopyranoside ligase, partial [Actinomycetes bacterium]